MTRSLPLQSLAVVVAVLALAAGAGALADADLSGNVELHSDGTPRPPEGQKGGAIEADPGLENSTGQGKACGLGCGLPTARSLLGQLAAPLSPTVIAGLAALAGLGVFVRRRGTHGAAVAPSEDSTTDESAPESSQTSTAATDHSYDTPDDPVARAFERLTAAVDADDAQTWTPREYEQAAVAAGFDQAAVSTVIDAFESVRYGDSEVTSAREHAVEGALATLGLDGGVDP